VPAGPGAELGQEFADSGVIELASARFALGCPGVPTARPMITET